MVKRISLLIREEYMIKSVINETIEIDEKKIISINETSW